MSRITLMVRTDKGSHHTITPNLHEVDFSSEVERNELLNSIEDMVAVILESEAQS